jgi:ABC-type dipeptide/oligopeptide/nickel transport system permease component
MPMLKVSFTCDILERELHVTLELALISSSVLILVLIVGIPSGILSFDSWTTEILDKALLLFLLSKTHHAFDELYYLSIYLHPTFNSGIAD